MEAAWPLGVDLLEWKKARAFYETHRDRLGRFLFPAEASFVLSSKKPHEALALILSAKEAAFKTLGLPWMGLSGFRSIRILPGRDRFAVRVSQVLKKNFPHPLEVSFSKNRRHVVATCHPCLPAPACRTGRGRRA